MPFPSISVHGADEGASSNADGSEKQAAWFDAFNFAPGQDANIRWLSRPGHQFLGQAFVREAEKFRITFDAENFQPDQIKIYVQNGKLTITGVYQEASEGRFMQKQFEKSFDIPGTADVELMAAYITSAHMLVVEIPLNLKRPQPSASVDHLNVNSSNQRRLSFSLDKFNTLNNLGSLPTSSNKSTLPPPQNQQVRRTSITKTTTTTTTSAAGHSPGLDGLLRDENTTSASPQSRNAHPSEHHIPNAALQKIIITEPAPEPPTTATTHSVKSTSLLSDTNLANLGIDIPPELLTVGGTITIQKRRVSVTRTADVHANTPPMVVSIPTNKETRTISSPVKGKTSSAPTDPPRSQQTNSNPPSPSPTNTKEPRSPMTTLTSNDRNFITLEEFLHNKTWNPSMSDDSTGKKMLFMRLELKPGTKADQLKITLNGHDLRVEIASKESADVGQNTSEHSYRQVTLFPTCDIHQLKTALKSDGFLHIQVPIQL